MAPSAATVSTVVVTQQQERPTQLLVRRLPRVRRERRERRSGVSEEEESTAKRWPTAQQLVQAALLCALVVQNSVQSLAARRSRLAAARSEKRTGCGMLAASSVATVEAIKAAIAIAMLGAFEVKAGPWETLRYVVVATRAGDAGLIAVPALCYVASNTLNYVAASHVDGPVLVVFGAIQVLFVSLFSVILLGRRLGPRKWLALSCLAASIACIQLDRRRLSPSSLRGLGLAALGCAVSGFAGVFFEKVLKRSPISLWLRNVHLALLSLPFAFFALDRSHLRRCGLFSGYGPDAWLFIAVKAFGGILVALVIKHTDNILKCFASAGSILVVSLAATFGDFRLTPAYVAGAAGVVFATMLYNDALRLLFRAFKTRDRPFSSPTRVTG
eukprot:CAMPEP_0197395040 /NCGR_PEP_ID=MMETSP1165-20131217/6302_1 /TAXON_ID=284809 /ORGANISM="Chrysocystis fragilis, Strain CCMP3189" /LENGTH=385 /DNA_ID=CAMNT_0042920785 /DNA_START=35 /DNA_END=1192 /DNA_ORIENTATION=+